MQIIFLIELRSLEKLNKGIGKSRLVLGAKIFFSIFVLITLVFLTLLLNFSMANSPCIGAWSEYGSDLLTDFESDMFGSISSKITNKSVPVAKRTRNFKTRQGEIARVPRPINSRRVQHGRNENKDKKNYVVNKTNL